MEPIVVHTDGASRGNPGPAAIAWVIKNGADHKEFGQKIGQTTNNQAEYRALLSALAALVEQNLDHQSIIIHLDSELVVRQIQGIYRVKDGLLRPLYTEAIGQIKVLERSGNTINLVSVKREENRRADELANLALDNQL